ncbi:MAG: hypothetical protein M1272_01060 [Firmicutes bacterium]|nr:hypothetical protein [Bacillota bacterium]
MANSNKPRTRRTPASTDKGNVVLKGRAVPMKLFPFETTAEQLAARVIEDIESGELKVGTVLPDRNALSSFYRGKSAINQRAVGDALYILAFRGYVTLGTEYNNVHRYIVTKPHRYESNRNGLSADLMTKIMRQSIPDATETPQPFPLMWEPIAINTTAIPDEFVADFSEGRTVDNVKVFHFVDRVWSARDVVARHETWVFPYPELAMEVINHISAKSPATLRDLATIIPVSRIDETFSVQVASPEQRGDFLVGSKWVEPFTIVTFHRRAYDRNNLLVFAQISDYRADRFTFTSQHGFVPNGSWLPQP